MENNKFLLETKLTGKRFEDHSLPLSILEDIAAFEELIFELAKQCFLEDNPTRQRVPKGFLDGINLKISEIKGGSTTTVINSVADNSTYDLLGEQNPDAFKYISQATEKLFKIIEDPDYILKNNIDAKFINYFNKIGKNLLDDETIFFKGNSIFLDKNVRKKILLSRTEKVEYSDVFIGNVLISEINKKENTFEVNVDSQTITCKIEEGYRNTVLDAFNEYEKNTLVSIKATGIYNRAEKLIGLENFESMDILDPFDVDVRLSQLSQIQDNWYEGNGKAPKKDFLLKFGQKFKEYYNQTLPLPAIYPTLLGNIQLEWAKDEYAISLEVDRESLESEYVYSDFKEDIDVEKSINLEDKTGWDSLNKLLTEHAR